jgi:hypothetical protein
MTSQIRRQARPRRAAAAALLLGLAAVAGAAAPVAAAEVEREKRGVCTGSARWELSLEKEYGRIEVSVEIDTFRSGRAWDVRAWHDGVRFVDVTRLTDREGEIDLDRVRRDTAGSDTISFRATSSTGEVCSGRLVI